MGGGEAEAAQGSSSRSHWLLSPAGFTAMEPPRLVTLIFLCVTPEPVLNVVFGTSGRPHLALGLLALMSLTDSSCHHHEPIGVGSVLFNLIILVII